MKADEIFSNDAKVVLPERFGQNPILKLLRFMGYGATFDEKKMEEGVCAGISDMWMHAAICGEKEELKFLNRLLICQKAFLSFINSEHIQRILKEKSLGNQLDLNNEKHMDVCKEEMKKMLDELTVKMRTTKIESLSSAENNLLEIRMLGDGIMMLQSPGIILGTQVKQFDKELIRPFIASVAIKEVGGIEDIIYDNKKASATTDVEIYLNRLGKIIDKSVEHPEEVVFRLGIIGSDGHGIGFRREGDGWLFFDPSNLPPKKIKANEIAHQIENVLKTFTDTSPNNFTFYVRLSVTKKTADENKSFCEAVKQEVKTIGSSPEWLTAAHVAASRGSVDGLNTLINEGADLTQQDIQGRTPLHIAAMSGNVEIFKLLAEKYVELNVDLNIKDIEQKTPAHYAAQYNHVDVMQTLASMKADLHAKDINGDTPAHIAANSNNAEVITVLHNANVNLNEKNNKGETPAHIAARSNNAEVITALHNASADLNAKNNNGDTPTHVAASSDNEEVITTLHNANVNLNEKNNKGETPAHCAAIKGNASALETLIDLGVDLNQLTTSKRTALYLSAEYKTTMLLLLALNRDDITPDYADYALIKDISGFEEMRTPIVEAFTEYLEDIDEEKKNKIIKNLPSTALSLLNIHVDSSLTKHVELSTTAKLMARGISGSTTENTYQQIEQPIQTSNSLVSSPPIIPEQRPIEEQTSSKEKESSRKISRSTP